MTTRRSRAETDKPDVPESSAMLIDSGVAGKGATPIADAINKLATVNPGLASEAAQAGYDLTQMTIADKVSLYRTLRDALAAERHAFEEFEAKTKAQMAEIGVSMYQQMTALGVTSMRTEYGTAFTQMKKSVRVGNWPEVLKYIQDNEAWDMLEKRLGKLATLARMEASEGEVPPGVLYEEEVEVVVRKS